jgi:hypothetical protein
MENIMPPFEYKPLVSFIELEISNEEKNKGDIDGVGPLGTRIAKEERIALKGRLLNKF